MDARRRRRRTTRERANPTRSGRRALATITMPTPTATLYKNTGSGWQQHTSSGWQAAGGDTSWANREQQARSTGQDRFTVSRVVVGAIGSVVGVRAAALVIASVAVALVIALAREADLADSVADSVASAVAAGKAGKLIALRASLPKKNGREGEKNTAED